MSQKSSFGGGRGSGVPGEKLGTSTLMARLWFSRICKASLSCSCSFSMIDSRSTVIAAWIDRVSSPWKGWSTDADRVEFTNAVETKVSLCGTIRIWTVRRASFERLTRVVLCLQSWQPKYSIRCNYFVDWMLSEWATRDSVRPCLPRVHTPPERRPRPRLYPRSRLPASIEYSFQ